jgi:hypothetical protein
VLQHRRVDLLEKVDQNVSDVEGYHRHDVHWSCD